VALLRQCTHQRIVPLFGVALKVRWVGKPPVRRLLVCLPTCALLFLFHMRPPAVEGALHSV